MEKQEINIKINQKNLPLFIAALQMKRDSLEKIQTKLVKEKQMKAAQEVLPDIILLEGVIKKLMPMRPVLSVSPQRTL